MKKLLAVAINVTLVTLGMRVVRGEGAKVLHRNC